MLTRTRLLVLAIIILAGTAGWLAYVVATPSPSISRVVTTGAIGPCTWFISLDGTTPVAEAMVGGLSVPPGDNLVGTAGQDPAVFINTLVASNTNLCFSNQSFVDSSSIQATGLSNVQFSLRGAIISAPNIAGSGTADTIKPIIGMNASSDISIIGGQLKSGEVATGTPTDNQVMGIRVDASARVTIRDTVFTNFNQRPIYVDASRTTKSTDITITNIKCLRTGATPYFNNCISMRGTNRIVVEGSTIFHDDDGITFRTDGNAAEEAKLQGVEDIRVSNNYVSFVSTSNSVGFDINFAMDLADIMNVTVSNNVFSSMGIKVQSGPTIPEKAVRRMSIIGNTISTSGTNNFGIDIGESGGQAADWSIIGNEFDNIGRGCITINTRDVNDNPGSIQIIGNSFRRCNQGNNASPYGSFVTLHRTASTGGIGPITIDGNSFETNAGSSNEVWVVFADASVSRLEIVNNNIRGTGSSGFFSINSAVTPILVANNGGYNPQAIFSVTAGASPFTTAVQIYPSQIQITALGGMTGWTCRGDTMINAVNQISPYLSSGQTCVLTWATTAPVFEVLPQ